MNKKSLLFILMTYMITNIGSIYWGMSLHKQGISSLISHVIKRGWITNVSIVPNYLRGVFTTSKHIEINIEFEELQKILNKRKESLKNGYLHSAPDDWVNAEIQYKGNKLKSKIRLKGDTSDHWGNKKKWSFKVKISGDNTLFGMKRFAIQNPRTRSYMNEWVLHKFLKYNKLIYLQYDFITVSINGDNLGLYAIEQNFDKNLIENNKLREGLLFKFDTGFYWYTDNIPSSNFGGTILDFYNDKRIVENKVLNKQKGFVLNKIELFRGGDLGINEVFDIDKFALFFAIIDLWGQTHGASLDNLKLYFNPITLLVEPVGYDFQAMAYSSKLLGENKQISRSKNYSPKLLIELQWPNIFFRDIKFYKKYIDYLVSISNRNILDNFFQIIDDDFNNKMNEIHKYYPWYNFYEKDILFANQNFIRNKLHSSKNLHVYLSDYDKSNRELTLKFRNIHTLPLEILYLSYSDSIEIYPAENLIIQAMNNDLHYYYQDIDFVIPDNIVYNEENNDNININYQILNGDTILSEIVQPIILHDRKMIRDSIIVNSFSNISNFPNLEIDENNKTIIIKSGQWDFYQDLIIPKDFTLLCSANTSLNLLQNSKIISFSPIKFIGSQNEPIIIESTDSTGEGLAVINANDKSLLKNVYFRNIQGSSQDVRSLSGSITFYKSECEFIRCKFIGCESEDALNIIESNFNITGCDFIDNKSDAIDIDFGEGAIVSSNFLNCGNDAIDVSGSNISLDKIYINSFGDKGISIGEKSEVTINNVNIINGEIAISVKDQSRLTGYNVTIKKCKVGLSAYCKKPIFGPGHININSIIMDSVILPNVLEKGSTIIVDGEIVEPNYNNVKEIFYGEKYGKSSQ